MNNLSTVGGQFIINNTFPSWIHCKGSSRMALKLGSLTGNIKLFEGVKSVDRPEGKPIRDPWLGIPFFLGIVVNGIGQGRQQHKGQVTADHHAYFIGAVGGFLHLRSEEHTSELQSRENIVCLL